MIAAALMLSALAASHNPEPPRAELCLAHVEAMIAQAQRETGMVAGPTWFVRSWWLARLPEDKAPEAWSAEQREALAASMPARQTADPEAYRADLQSCVGEAIEGGALP
jgi:hypothetical protein